MQSSLKNPILRGGSQKTDAWKEFSKNGGLEQFANLNGGGLVKKKGMFLREVDTPMHSMTKFPVSAKVKFSRFCDLRSKNILLLKQFPGDQCKYIIHENFVNKLKSNF